MISKSYDPKWVFYFATVHVIGFVGLWYAFQTSWHIVAAAIAYFFACHLAITCGAHRLWAHTSYKAPAWWHYLLATLFSGVAQGSVTFWAGKHIQHHHEEDSPTDPHSPVQIGFWAAHMGVWMTADGFVSAPLKYLKMVKKRDAYGAGEWSDRNRIWLIPTMVFGVPTLIGWAFGDWLAGLLVIGFARLVFQYHLTWIVNSYCHMYGEPNQKQGSSTNNWWLALITVGESLHANHHDSMNKWWFASKWYHLDVGGWVIALGAFLHFIELPQSSKSAT